MVVDTQHDVVIGASFADKLEFVHVVLKGGRRTIVVVDGHTCGWDSGVGQIARPVLAAAVGAVQSDLPPSAAMEAARVAFEEAAAPYPDDDLAGDPAAQLTLVQIEDGLLDCLRLGSIALFTRVRRAVRVDGTAHAFQVMKRGRQDAVSSRARMARGDLVVVARPWIGFYLEPDPMEALVQAHDEPDALVHAALERYRRDVEDAVRARRLIGERPYWLAATRV